MNSSISDQIWQYVEKLYVHCYELDGFLKFLKNKGIEIPENLYENFEVYRFMTTDNRGFSEIMRNVPIYRSLSVLSEIIFDSKIKSTEQSSWNYYGVLIKNWYPQALNLIKQDGFIVDLSKKEIVSQAESTTSLNIRDFIEVSFSDPFLDPIKKEINECFAEGYYIAVMLLSRKLAECLIVRLFESVFPKRDQDGKYNSFNHGLLYNVPKGKVHELSVLLENIKNNANAFHEDKLLIEDMCTAARPFKNNANHVAHRDYKNPNKNSIDEQNIPNIINLLWRLYRKYCA